MLWQRLTGESFDKARWLAVDEAALEKSSIEMVVQVNGKLRSKFQANVDMPKELVEAQARQDENVVRFLEGMTIRKVVHVPNKLINFVVSQ